MNLLERPVKPKNNFARVLGLVTVVIWSLAAMTVFVEPSMAANFYVATTGDDANDCMASSTPCGTLNGAFIKASGSSGATIHIAAGTYDNTNASTNYESFDIVGAGMDQTILDGGGTDRVLKFTGSTILLAELTVRNGYIKNNAGGGIWQGGGILTVSKVRLTGNKAENGTGGAGFFVGGTLNMNNSLLDNNSSFGSGNPNGGGFYISNASTDVFSLDNVTIAGNSAASGSGLHVQGAGKTKMTNVTISGNTASWAAVTFTGTSTNTMINVTIADNVNTNSSAPAVQNYATVSWANSIVTGSGSGSACSVDSSSTWTSNGNNLSSDATCLFTGSGDAENSDPLLMPLGAYGGDIPTHALKPGSLAVDSGNNVNCPSYDARNVTRPKDGDNDATATCDKGAFEFERVSSTGVTISGDASGFVNSSYTMRADVLPVTNTFPITYTWQADDHPTDVVHTGNATDSVTFTWTGAGTKNITVTAYNGINSVTVTHQINITAGTQAVTGVTISGPASGGQHQAYDFTAAVAPASATAPVTYTWKVDGGAPIVQPSQGTTSALNNITFDSDGPHTVEVTAANSAGSANDSHAITITSWYVNGTVGDDTNTCTSAATACKTISGAITKAADGGTVFVAAGTYSEWETGTLSKSLSILGSGRNTTIVDGGGNGAVFRLQNSGATLDITLADMTIRNGNRSASSGGGIANTGTNLVLRRILLENNQAQDAGGGIYNDGGSLTISDSILRGNSTAVSTGSALVNYSGTLNISNSAVIENKGAPAALNFLNNSTGTLTNVTVSGNGDGLAVSTGSTVTVVNSTIADNRGYGINNYGTMKLKNTVIADNGAGNCSTGTSLAPVSEGNNLDSDDTCILKDSSDLVKINPRLAPLSKHNNTWLHTFNRTSPLLDQGTNNGCPATDQRGEVRPYDGDGDGTPTCDIGAFELGKKDMASPWALFLPAILGSATR